MDFWGTVTVLFRRWYISAAAFGVALLAMVGAYVSVPVFYVSGATLVLTTPYSAPKVDGRPADTANPLLNFDKGLSLSASIVMTAISTPEVTKELGASPKGDPAFTINSGNPNPEALAQSPFLFITGRSTNPGEARAIVQRVVDKARSVLAFQQELRKVPRQAFITLSVITPPIEPLPERAGKLRAAAIALGSGGVASLGAA
ncbi:hypothetical protein, partial [Actinocorallia lasiicapitis]